MELTPELFEQIEFTERRKGYDTDQVETFLEQAGTALAQLLARVRHTEERAGHAEARLGEADARIRAAEERAARAENAARQAQSQAGARASSISEEAEVEQAAKTLLMARRTAEAMEVEARNQAQALLGEAKTRADRQLAEAQAEAEELVRRARVQADAEFADRRERALEEVQHLEARRSQLGDVITQLEGRLAGYREDLTRTAEELTLLASDPDRLGARPTLSIPPDEVLTPRPLAEELPVEPAVPDTAAAPVEATAAPVADLSHAGGPATEAVPAAGEPVGSEWGPGSWSELQSRIDEDDDVVNEPAPEVVDEVEMISLSDRPVEVDPTPTRDRYMQQLDDAVNDPEGDEAMTAFFEGSNEVRNRRFGWRR